MVQTRILALLAALLVAPSALAGGYVTLGCNNGWQQEFLVGTGQEFRGQGLELWPMVCLSNGKVSSYSRVMNPQHFQALESLAAQAAPDGQRLADWMNHHGDLAAQLGVPAMFGQIEGITFGDIRSTVANAARPTEETILTSRFVYYVQATCAGRLVPFDFYVEQGAPCPACQGSKLAVIDTGNRAEWE